MSRHGLRRDIFLALGANEGPREAALRFACNYLHRQGIEVVSRSGLYLTEPVGPPQPPYLNQVIEVRSALPARRILAAGLAAEAARGRQREEKNGPRPLDVDLLLDGAAVVDEPGLTVPHPRMHRRRFVLVPLAEIAATARHPVLGRSVAALLQACADEGKWFPPDRRCLVGALGSGI